jgi:hypothetical protein
MFCDIKCVCTCSCNALVGVHGDQVTGRKAFFGCIYMSEEGDFKYHNIRPELTRGIDTASTNVRRSLLREFETLPEIKRQQAYLMSNHGGMSCLPFARAIVNSEGTTIAYKCFELKEVCKHIRAFFPGCSD